jgi:hypothetical protein
MDKNRFNKEVRPYVIEIPIGTQGIGFDRLDLDAWIEQYKYRSGRLPGTNSRSMEPWDVQYRQDSSKGGNSGTFGNKFTDAAFEKALAQSYSAKQKATSRDGSRK